MSMCMCSECGDHIDSDIDPDCFVEMPTVDGKPEIIALCENCRDDEMEREYSANQND